MAAAVVHERLGPRARTIDASRRATPARPLLWGAEDLLRWAITTGLGGIVIAVGWYIAAGEATFGQQIGPLDAALAGLLLSGIGNLAWLLHGRRALGERRRLLLPELADATTGVDTRAGVVSPLSTPTEQASVDVFVAGEGMERFHRPECALASGRSGWMTTTRRGHEDAGRLPCGVCRP
ncbi:MAG TPA: hypothetical protein VK773_03160 [Acidimicrobiales bacterium]|jgi:hypothetical protein|nr:hypothetical protein [Acidimicrobiales bacterium]